MGRQLRVTPIVDDSFALRSFKRMQSGAAGFTGSLAGIGKKGTSFGGLAAAMSASGLLGQFSELQGLLGNFSTGLDHLGGKRVNVGKILGGVGIGAAALGGLGESLASPLEAARAQLDQSIKNAGGSSAALAKPIGDEQKRMQGLGFTYADTDASLSKLTQGFGSGRKAIAEEGLVADLAARNHTDLSSATDLVVKAYAKSPMVLRQFGINMADTTAKGKAAASAQKAHGKAQDELSKARQRLSQLQERLGASGAAKDASASNKRAANAKAVLAAQDQLAAAGQHLQDVEARLRAGHVSAASAQSELVAAQNRVLAAQTHLNDAQSKGVDVTGLSVSQQQELSNAQAAVADAQQKSNLTGYVAASTAGDLNKANLTGQQILDMLTKKTHGLAQAQANTFGGDLRKWKASVIDFGATWGEKFAKPLIAIGPALAGVGMLLESNFFGKIGKGITGLSRGVLGLPKAVGGLLGIVKPGAPVSATGGTPKVTPAVPPAGEEGLSSAASALEQAAAALKEAAAAMQGAAGEESGAAAQLDTSATGLDTAGGGLDAAGGGLTSSSAALDVAGTGLDASGTALDASAAALDGAAAAGAAGGAAGAAEGAAGAGALGGRGAGLLSKIALPAAAGFAGYSITKSALGSTQHPSTFGKGVQGAALAVGDFLGFGAKVQGKLGAGSTSAVMANHPGYVFGRYGFVDPKGKGHPWADAPPSLADARWHYTRMALGGVVHAHPGGTPIIAGEGGRDEIVGSPETIVGALKSALGGAGAGPSVVHYHEHFEMRGATIKAANLDGLLRELERERTRANFSGEGHGGGEL